VAGANPARCTERTLSGSKAAKSAQSTDITFLGVSRVRRRTRLLGAGAQPTDQRQGGKAAAKSCGGSERGEIPEG